MSNELPDDIVGLSQEAFNQWRHHPVTKAVRAYLQHWRDRQVEEHTNRWEAGELLSEKEEDAIATAARMVIEIKNLEFEHIARFYNFTNDEESNDK